MVSEHRGVPHDLLIELARQFQITNFVETGTFRGNTAHWASRNFENVITVEFSEVIYKQVTERYRDVSNIKFCFGHSTAQLTEIVPSLKSPAVFWLDAHWSGGTTYGEGDECPILKEIEIIEDLGLDHFIFIDDARMFLAPPPHPHNRKEWPGIVAVIAKLTEKNPDREIFVSGDVIVAVPKKAADIVADYYQNLATGEWKAHKERSVVGRALTKIAKSVN